MKRPGRPHRQAAERAHVDRGDEQGPVPGLRLLKEQLRAAFATKGVKGRQLFAGWLAWAGPSRLPAFVKLAKKISRYQQLIRDILEQGLSNAHAEATNMHLRVLTRRAYGYHSPDALIAMAMLTRGGLCPVPAGRAA